VTPNRHRFCGWALADGNGPANQSSGYVSFYQHAAEMDAVHPDWWYVTSPTSFSTVYGVDDPQMLSLTTHGGQRTLIMPLVAAVDSSGPGYVHQMLYDQTLQQQHIAQLVSITVSHGYDGLDLDYEHLSASDRDAFSSFVAAAAQAMHAAGKQLSLAINAETGGADVSDYDKLSAAADTLHLMGYDYHWLGSHPGPIAPLGWLQQVTQYIQTVAGGTRNQKFVLGLANYGLAGGSATTWLGTSADAAALAGPGYATTTDHMSSCPFGNQAPGRSPNAMTSQGQLFFEDLASMEEKATLAQTAGLGGITYWNMGGEPSGFFQMVRSHFPQ
jgi:spore germination protein YaaH